MVHREPLLWKLGLQRLDKNIDLLSPGFLIKPEVCLTIQVNNNGSQLKHPNCTGLEYARDFGNSMRVFETSNKVVSLLLYSSQLLLSAAADKRTSKEHPNDEASSCSCNVQRGPGFNAPLGQQAWKSRQTAYDSSNNT